MDSKHGHRSAAKRSRCTEGMAYRESSSLMSGVGDWSVRAMTRPGKRTRSSLTPWSTLTGSEFVPGNSSNTAEVRSRPANAKAFVNPRSQQPLTPHRAYKDTNRVAIRRTLANNQHLGLHTDKAPPTCTHRTREAVCSRFLSLSVAGASLEADEDYHNYGDTRFLSRVKP